MTECATTKLNLVEIRVHGVSGTPPQEMLSDAFPTQVTGDSFAGFFDGDAIPAGHPRLRPRRLQAYSWGGITSGASSRALWLLLAPFALLNAAAHMFLPEVADGPSTRFRQLQHLLRRFIRWGALWHLLAATLTATVVLATSGVSMDLVGWQCAAHATQCSNGQSITRFLGHGWFADPGHRLVVTALMPLVILVLAWLLSHQTEQRYEAIENTQPPNSALGDGACLLEQADLWSGTNSLRALRALHMTVGFSIIAALIVHPVELRARHTGDRFGHSVGVIGLWLTVALALAAVMACTATKKRVVKVAAPVMQVMGLFALVAAGGWALIGRSGWKAANALPAFQGAVTGLFMAQVALLVIAMIVCLIVLTRRLPKPKPCFAGLGGPSVAAVAVFLLAAASAGFALRVASYLGKPGTAAHRNQGKVLVLPSGYAWASVAVIPVAAAVLAAFLVALVVVHRLRRKELKTTPAATPAQARRASARAQAAFTDWAPVFLGSLVIFLVVVAVVGVVATCLWPGAPLSGGDEWLKRSATAGAWAIGGFALVLFIAARAAFKSDRTRRTVGVIWDLTLFWPRSAHPFAPPCYAERTVPELTNHIRSIGDSVILSGHSQGSVICAAALFQLDDSVRSRCYLVTHGSPLRRLYARVYPAYFGDPALKRLGRLQVGADGGAKWRNLYRKTDPIGGKVEVYGVDREVPAPRDFSGEGTGIPVIRRHSNYFVELEYEGACRGADRALP